MTENEQKTDILDDISPDYGRIEQNEERGPGVVLYTTYIVITLFMIIYFFSFKNWKSGYEYQQTHIQSELAKKGISAN
jgi:hypothetical protein